MAVSRGGASVLAGLVILPGRSYRLDSFRQGAELVASVAHLPLLREVVQDLPAG